MDMERYFTESQRNAIKKAEDMADDYKNNTSRPKIAPELCAHSLVMSLHAPKRKWYAPWARQDEHYLSSLKKFEDAFWDRILDTRTALSIMTRHATESSMKCGIKDHQINVLRSVIQGVIRNTKEEPTKELLAAALAVADEIVEDLKELEGNTP